MRVLVVGLVIATAVSGCFPLGLLGPSVPATYATVGGADEGGAAACEHPYPCGDEWPDGVEGPFARGPRIHVPILAQDNVTLDGYVWLPALPEGVGAPVVLTSQPYAGQCSIPPAIGVLPSCMWAINHASFVGSWFWVQHHYDELLDAGYAIAVYSVRGTGASGGCFDLLGPLESRDQATIISYLANQTWSNGRVAMWGASYMGATAWEGAVEGPLALKTVVPAASVPDFYLTSATPNGALRRDGGWYFAGYTFAQGIAPPGGAWVNDFLAWEERTAAGPCVESVSAMLATLNAQAMDDRDGDFYEPRRITHRFANVTAAVFVIHGFQETYSQTFQEDRFWETLPATVPKRMLLGQWGHVVPATNGTGGDLGPDLVTWFDYWLKGQGEPNRVGVVDYQDTSLAWHDDTAWPPAAAAEETHALASGDYAPDPRVPSTTFVATSTGEIAPRCNPSIYGPRPTSVDYVGPALTEPTLLSGNARADLVVSSDLPGGTIAADLYRVPPNYACSGEGTRPTGLEWIARGAADLRFVDGGYQGSDFPLGAARTVRIDFSSAARHLMPGDSVALVLTGGGSWGAMGIPYEPSITIHPGSTLTLPMAEAS